MDDKLESELRDFIADQVDFEIKEGATEKDVLSDFVSYLDNHKEIEVPEDIADFLTEIGETDTAKTSDKVAPVKEKEPEKSSGGTVTIKCTMKRKISFSFGEFDFSSGEAEIPEEFVEILCSMDPYSRA